MIQRLFIGFIVSMAFMLLPSTRAHADALDVQISDPYYYFVFEDEEEGGDYCDTMTYITKWTIVIDNLGSGESVEIYSEWMDADDTSHANQTLEATYTEDGVYTLYVQDTDVSVSHSQDDYEIRVAAWYDSGGEAIISFIDGAERNTRPPIGDILFAEVEDETYAEVYISDPWAEYVDATHDEIGFDYDFVFNYHGAGLDDPSEYLGVLYFLIEKFDATPPEVYLDFYLSRYPISIGHWFEHRIVPVPGYRPVDVYYIDPYPYVEEQSPWDLWLPDSYDQDGDSVNEPSP